MTDSAARAPRQQDAGSRPTVQRVSGGESKGRLEADPNGQDDDSPRRRVLPNARVLLLDIYGGFVRRIGGSIAIADLVRLVEEFGVDAPATRAAASRMTRAGLLTRCRGVDGAVDYALTPETLAILESGDRRIFNLRQQPDVEEGWVLVVFSIPENERRLRHVLRSRLTRLGLGNLSPGVWLAPYWLIEELRRTTDRFGLTRYVDFFEAHYRGRDELRRLVERCWDLESMRQSYRELIEQHEPILQHWRSQAGPFEPRNAFVDYVLTQSTWRRLAYLDPGLAPGLLPPDWEGHRAAQLFFELRGLLDGPALTFVKAITRR